MPAPRQNACRPGVLSGGVEVFVVTGGGGTTLRKKDSTESSALNHFNQNVHGFTHLEITEQRLVIRHIGAEGGQLHAFAKSPQGAVEIL